MNERIRVVWATVVPGLPMAVVLEPALTGRTEGWVPFLATALVMVHGGLMLSAAARRLPALAAVLVVVWMAVGLVASGVGLLASLIAMADDGPRLDNLLGLLYVSAVIFAYLLQLRFLAGQLGSARSLGAR
jgi:hypothetical protein